MSIITTAGAALNLYRAILTAAEHAPEERAEWNSCITFRHGRTMLKLAHTSQRLRQFAADMLKSWAIWGGGQKPEMEKKRARSQWSANKLRAYKCALEDGDMANALSLAEDMQCKAFAHATKATQAVIYVAPEPFEYDGATDLVSALREDGKYIVMHWPSGLSVMGYGANSSARSRGSAEAKAREFLATMPRENITSAINAAPLAPDMLPLWCAQNGIATCEARPQSEASEAIEAQAVAVPEAQAVAEVATAAEVAEAAEVAPADLQDVHDAPSVAPVATPKHLQRFSLLSNDEAMLRIKNAGFDVVERMSKNNDGIRKIRLHLRQGNTTFHTSITLPAACDIVEWLEAQAQKLKNGSLIYGANLLSHIASPAQVATPEPVQNVAPPVVQKAEELTPRVAASPGFINLMAQARAARQLARETIARAKASSKGAHSAPQADDGNPYPYLIPTEGQRGGVAAAKNIRLVLKNEFPGIKFRVTSDYSSVNVKWTDGPTAAQVDQALAPFDIGHSDSQSDYFYTTSTRFSDTFGGVQYLFTSRTLSDAAIGTSLIAVFGPNGPSVEDYRKGRAWHEVQHGTFTGAQMWDDWWWMAMVRRHADGSE